MRPRSCSAPLRSRLFRQIITMRDRTLVGTFRSRLFDLHPLIRLAIFAWAALIIGVTLRLAIKSGHAGSVFPTYRNAARHWLGGENLYTLDISVQFFRYHPIVAVSFVPWTAIPVTPGEILWRWLGTGLILAGLGVWIRQMVTRPLTPARHGLLFLLVAPLALQSINNGQINAHILGLILLGLAAIGKQRWTVAAGLLAAATLIKIYPAVVALLVISVYPRAFAWRYLLMLFAGCAAPFLTQHPSYASGQYRLWFEYLQGDSRFGATLDVAYRDFCLVMRLWFVPLSETAYRAIEVGSAAMMAALCVQISRRNVDSRVIVAAIMNLACLWMTLLGPSTESNTYTLLGPTAAMLLVLAPPQRLRLTWGVAGLGYSLLILPTIATAFPGGKRVQEWGPQPMGAILLLIVAIVDLWPYFSGSNCARRLVAKGSD